MCIKLAADDIVVALLHYAFKDDGTFTANREVLNRAFFKLKKKYPSLMHKFSFSERELYPDSLELDIVLMNLMCADLITLVGDTYKVHSGRIYFVFRRYSKKLLKENGIDSATIKSAAKLLKKRCGV